MRSLFFTLAATASALAAVPASAQYSQPYQAQPQGYAYGHNNHGQMRSLHVRIDALQRQIVRLDRRNLISSREARRLDQDARQIERRLRYASQNGLHRSERYDIQQRLAYLEQRVFRNGRRGNRWGNGYNQQGQQGGYDRDRDGRDDRYEDDRGRDRDGGWDGERRRDRDDD